jgi:hypothetical protein
VRLSPPGPFARTLILSLVSANASQR